MHKAKAKPPATHCSGVTTKGSKGTPKVILIVPRSRYSK